MRLLVVSQYFWPENFRINDLVAEMVNRGHEVTVLTGVPNYPEGLVNPEFLAAPQRFSEWSGARIVRVPMFARGQGGLRLLLNYLSFAISASTFGIKELRGQPFDAIFVYQLSPVTSALPAILLRAIKRAPMAMWVLDLWPETLSAVGVIRSKWILTIVGRLVSFIYRHCDLILAQSNSFVSTIKQYADEGQRVQYFPSWAESIFQSEEIRFAPEIPVASNTFNIIFAGNVGDAQDFPAILSAAELLKSQSSIRWWIVGDGRMAVWVSDEIERRGLRDSVFMLGRYPLQRMPSFFKHADALLVTLKDEPIFAMTIPGKLQSYLAAGIPVLAMLNGEGAEIVMRSGSGLACAANDYYGLASAVLKLSQMSEEERNAMGANGKKVSEVEFGRDGLMDRLETCLLQLYQDVRVG
jgi:colanic acid biosynthesis glycosyl transferase WcaI